MMYEACIRYPVSFTHMRNAWLLHLARQRLVDLIRCHARLDQREESR
jgi:hypothetical protein